jgi:hypothetical protein
MYEKFSSLLTILIHTTKQTAIGTENASARRSVSPSHCNRFFRTGEGRHICVAFSKSLRFPSSIFMLSFLIGGSNGSKFLAEASRSGGDRRLIRKILCPLLVITIFIVGVGM